MEERLRLLALWHVRRRAVDQLLEPLLAYGPPAVERVSARLTELTAALDTERAAFDAFAAQAAATALTPVPAAAAGVDELARARARATTGGRPSRPGQPEPPRPRQES